MIIKVKEGNLIQVFDVYEPDQCTKRQYNKISITFIFKESVSGKIKLTQVKSTKVKVKSKEVK